MTTNIVVTLESGLIQDIQSDSNIRVLILDFDTDGAEEEGLSKTPQGQDVITSEYSHQLDPEGVRLAFSLFTTDKEGL